MGCSRRRLLGFWIDLDISHCVYRSSEEHVRLTAISETELIYRGRCQALFQKIHGFQALPEVRDDIYVQIVTLAEFI
jgi:hypothetical protein